MNTTKAIYWIALAVFALALNSEYRHGQFPALHRVADRAGSTLCHDVTRAEQTYAMARFVIGRESAPANDLLALRALQLAETRAEVAEQARYQAEIMREQMREQANIIRAQVQIQRSEVRQFGSNAIRNVRLSDTGNRRVVLDNGCTRIRINGNPPAIPVPDPSDEDADLF